MPPKRGNIVHGSRVARHGRGSTRRQGRSGKDHVRVLSDITEESASQVQVQFEDAPKQAVLQKRTASGPKKRSFNEFAAKDVESDLPKKRETRSQTTKRNKQHHESTVETMSVEPEVDRSHESIDAMNRDEYQDVSPSNSNPPVYSPSYRLLFFVLLSNLDTDADTESITLSLIEFTLAETNWHKGLSGMVQPVTCFLMASLLTRRQNLVEEIAASVEIFGLKYEELVEGYRLLWVRRGNMVPVVGVYADKLASLPEPALLLAPSECEGAHSDSYAVGEVR